MTSAVFETERFRVHITGKAAWVEAKEGANWVFCNWHALPVAAECADSDALKAAVADYEQARSGDISLRSALSGIRQQPARPTIKPAAQTALKAPARRPIAQAKPVFAKRSSGYYGFRAPLRPPLLTPAGPALGPNAPGN